MVTAGHAPIARSATEIRWCFSFLAMKPRSFRNRFEPAASQLLAHVQLLQNQDIIRSAA
jgi:hypothetical protein